ncbi:MAG: hypothetical protein L0Y64_26485, partial [Myxococcaceae bacterium]|nr:hypothetical protein [Myxococcaceae bacterium]
KLGGEALGNLVLVWRDSRREVDRDEELAIEQAALVTAEAVSRLVAPPQSRTARATGLGRWASGSEAWSRRSPE